MDESFDLFDQPDPRPPPEPRVWSVSQVNRAVRQLLEDTIAPFWVTGEVVSWTRARSGHCYFTLKDEKAQLRAVLWKSDAERLPTDPPEGMPVRVFGALTLYEARGEYQLTARRIETAEGEGLWRLALERLRAKLDAEGLLAPERKRALPRRPAAVGVVTSVEGAALRDILRGLRDRAPWVHVVVRSSRVQGEGAAAEIARAVSDLGQSGLVDVLIVGRGGGSMEDLWAFNEEVVARAIAESPVPVVSAVGHEVDVTIADLVADVRAATPSAAAHLCVPGADEVRSILAGLGPRLARSLRAGLERKNQIRDRLFERAERGARRRLERGRQDVARLASHIDALSPLGTLRRGFAVPLSEDAKVLRSVASFSDGQAFRLRVSDGSVPCQVHGESLAEPLGEGSTA